MPLTAPQSADKNGLLATLRLEAIRAHHCTGVNLVSQMVGQLQTELENQGCEKGACLAMSAKWLEGQKTGSPFLKQLLGLGGAVNKDVLSGIVGTHKSTDGGIEAARKFAKSLNGAIRFLTESRFEASKKKENLGDALFDEQNVVSSSPLVLLGVYGGVFFHAMALDMTNHTFFDPNFGEFKFNSGDDLKGFLNRVFTFEEDPNVHKWWYVRKNAYSTYAYAWVCN
jgi:YopT peptidase